MGLVRLCLWISKKMFVYFKLVKFGVTYLSIYVELGQFKERKLKKEENIKQN